MKWSTLIPSLLLMLAVISCQPPVPINDIERAPTPTAADEPFADAYRILDGTWRGTFFIYEDTSRVAKVEKELRDINRASVDSFRLLSSIAVKQVYTSESPYFQRVTITDTYADQPEPVISQGVNKVQDGQLWCVVHKPDETVIHAGKLVGAHTIIWSREEQDPQRIEYFRESVADHTYEIVGWGYYEGDDTSLSPRLWFYAAYERQP